jgi:periplasmic protein TonB
MAIVTLAGMLYFSRFIKPNLPSPPPHNAVEVHLIQPPVVPKPQHPAGLMGGATPAKPKPKPRKRIVRKPPAPANAKSAAASVALPSPAGPAAKPAAGVGVPGGTGVGSGYGLGNDSSGARAIYAPLPKIPDELRQADFKSVAVAQFKVSAAGAVTVSLITPTPYPRLNEILLATLRQWRFFPAMRGGVAVNSEFEVRIPISVE